MPAQALAGAPLRITLIDRHNYHLFQPLLYQVATAPLSPGDIASPIRWVLSGASASSRVNGCGPLATRGMRNARSIVFSLELKYRKRRHALAMA